MRCVICDASDQGLSTFRPDGHYHSSSFTLISGDYHCRECADDIDEVIQEFNEEDDEDDEA